MNRLGIKSWTLEETSEMKIISGECWGWPAVNRSGEASAAECYFFNIKKPKDGKRPTIEVSVKTCTHVIRALPWGTRLDLRDALAEEFADA